VIGDEENEGKDESSEDVNTENKTQTKTTVKSSQETNTDNNTQTKTTAESSQETNTDNNTQTKTTAESSQETNTDNNTQAEATPEDNTHSETTTEDSNQTVAEPNQDITKADSAGVDGGGSQIVGGGPSGDEGLDVLQKSAEEVTVEKGASVSSVNFLYM
jgi:hypothetical protein